MGRPTTDSPAPPLLTDNPSVNRDLSRLSSVCVLPTLVLLGAALTGCAASGPGAGSGPAGETGGEAPTRELNVTPDQRVKAAEMLRDAGQLDAALGEFNRVLADNPKMVQAHVGVGTVQHRQEKYEEARNTFAFATTLDALNFDARYFLGLMQQVLGETGAAIASYRQALQINPDDAEAHRDLASAYLQVGRPDLAVVHAEASVRLDPAGQQAWCNLAAVYSLLKRYEDALNAYRTATELADLDAPVLLGLGDTHLKLNNIRRAINTLNELVRRFPSGVAHERLGYAFFRGQRFREAERHYRSALDYDGEATSALNGLGACLVTSYANQRDRRDQVALREAVRLWRKSVQIDRRQPAIVDLLSRYSLPG